VPLLFSWPGVIPAGIRSDRVVSALDVTATILDALGAPALPGSAGRTLLPILRGENVDWRDEAFSEYCSDEEWSPPGGCYQRMIRRGDWKLVYYHGDRPQLFNLKEDPKELANRAGDPACGEVLSELRGRLLEDWDPEEVVRRMAAKRREQEILSAWAANTRPASQYLWGLRPEMFYLD
jgi:choline-sulfatase